MRFATDLRSVIGTTALGSLLCAATIADAGAESKKPAVKPPADQAGVERPLPGKDSGMFPNMSVFDAPKMDKPVGTPSNQPAEPVLTPYKQPKKQ